MDWKPIAQFDKNCCDFPNRLVMLEIKNPDHHALVDTADATIITMGHWYPDDNEPAVNEKVPLLPGKWVAVGWDWDQDCFTECHGVEPVMWAEMPVRS